MSPMSLNESAVIKKVKTGSQFTDIFSNLTFFQNSNKFSSDFFKVSYFYSYLFKSNGFVKISIVKLPLTVSCPYRPENQLDNIYLLLQNSM